MSPALSPQTQKVRLRTAQFVALGFILLIAAGIAAPFLGVNRFRERIRASLEAAFMRQVTLGEVHLNLFTGPGFQVEDVEIGEDPALGSEPFAYIKTLSAVPRLWSLWTGRLEFASLRLEGAQVNLARNSTPSGG
ncbi:MAG: AsmA family protein, partial [Acidobacteriota bacterium]|nr:AsmA family protein [Acidobacteriota bacterium]